MSALPSECAAPLIRVRWGRGRSEGKWNANIGNILELVLVREGGKDYAISIYGGFGPALKEPIKRGLAEGLESAKGLAETLAAEVLFNLLIKQVGHDGCLELFRSHQPAARSAG